MARDSNDELLERLAGDLQKKTSQFDWGLILGMLGYIAGIFGAVLIATTGNWVGYSFKLNTLNIPMIFGVLILASLFVERSVEVFMLTFRDPRACTIEEGQEFYRSRVSSLKSELSPKALATELPADVRAQMADDAQQIKHKIDKYEEMILANQLALIPFLSRRRKFSLGLALLFGIFAASVGFRFFTQIVDPQETSTNTVAAISSTHGVTVRQNHVNLLDQHYFFNVVDILLTGALLAGGSAAVHSLMTNYTNLVNAPKKT